MVRWTIEERLSRIEARRVLRSTLGNLRDCRIKASTKARYEAAIAFFFASLASEDESLVSRAEDLDGQLCRHVERLWSEGERRPLAEDLLSGLKHFCPALKGKFPEAWQLVGVWQFNEPPCRATPFEAEDVMALAAVAFDLDELEVGVALLVAFQGLLRTGEVGSMLLGDCVLNAAGTVVTIDLGYTKGGTRRHERESVGIDDPDVVRLLLLCLERGKPGDRLVRGGTPALRRVFAKLLVALGMSNGGYQLYSLRRGGATSMFRATANLSAVVVRGRWQNQKTARQYIDSGKQDLAKVALPSESRRKLARALAKFHDFVAC